MSLLKQSPSKNLRTKGFKVKNVVQICLLLAICIWLLHQVKHCYDEKRVYKKDTATVSEVQSGHESIKFGRKDIRSQTLQTTLDVDRQEDRQGVFNMEFEEVGENKNEESEEEGRGGGDDEIDGHDQEKLEEEESEEFEDPIDEEDRVEEESEEQENEGAGSHFEDGISSVNQAQHGGERNSQTKEEQLEVEKKIKLG
ncbi:hypothetical protein Patl1_08754 [Pistacia atlantica]|uniref:Uncharacterized protein n=1 Tax=Pistacia atlantica TaxID=434234 RepID=A0ACC1AJN3_9ROSI|nr:hypothetical protein Patl1_08754 [Pistacia atlantica]